MQILSTKCKKMAKIINDYDKWEIKFCDDGESYHVHRNFGNIEVDIWQFNIFIGVTNGFTVGQTLQWANNFNIIESIYLDFLCKRLRSYKEKSHKRFIEYMSEKYNIIDLLIKNSEKN